MKEIAIWIYGAMVLVLQIAILFKDATITNCTNQFERAVISLEALARTEEFHHPRYYPTPRPTHTPCLQGRR